MKNERLDAQIATALALANVNVKRQVLRMLETQGNAFANAAILARRDDEVKMTVCGYELTKGDLDLLEDCTNYVAQMICFREITNCPLKTAKEAIDEMARTGVIADTRRELSEPGDD